jgi:hypothetical protein
MVLLIEWPDTINYSYKCLQQMKTYRENDRLYLPSETRDDTNITIKQWDLRRNHNCFPTVKFQSYKSSVGKSYLLNAHV